MFGFTQEEMKVLGSRERFANRIEKFRSRNELDKDLYNLHLETLELIEIERLNGECIDDHKEWCEKYIEDNKNYKRPFRIFHPVIEHHFWWLMHNWAAHFMIGLLPLKPFFDFHDWTSVKLNAE